MIDKISGEFKDWISKYSYRLAVFNIILVSLFLLRSAGYFHPYFPISVNFIVIFGLVISSILLNTNSAVIIFIAIVFWLFAALLKVMGIDVWAERTGIYAFESLFFGVILFMIESYRFKNKGRK